MFIPVLSVQSVQCRASAGLPEGGGERQSEERGEGSRCTNGNVSCGEGEGGGKEGGRRWREPGGSGGDQVPGDPGSGGRLIRFLMFLLQPRPDINIQTKLKQFCLLKHKQ